MRQNRDAHVGKFSQTTFWKHSDCLDAFFMIERIRFDENGTKATLQGSWMTQGIASYWASTNLTRLNIKSSEYNKWVPYTPVGNEYV
jgi:hypothetical protein